MDSIPSAKELMPQDAYKDLYFFMHFIDDWEADSDNEWDEYFMDPKVESVNTTATYWAKFSLVEDGFNSRWQEIINFGN